jgi:hypothetical protein
VVGIFKQKTAGNTLLLILYALVLKFYIFLHPYLPVIHREDNYLYRFIITGINSLFQSSTFPYSLLTFLLLYTQATLFNTICNYHKILPRSNYLPGMAYLLITSLMKDWNHFSAPLLVNSIMIWCWYKMVDLYNTQKPVGAIFNIGLLTGVATLLYAPAVAFLLMLLFALIVMRPFRVQEWFVGLLGFTFPYYFLLLFLYFSRQLQWKNILPEITITMPALPGSVWTFIGIFLLVLPFIIGGFFVQNNLNKMLIQGRKCWSTLLIYMIVAVLVILINKAGSYENWIVAAAPFAAFHAAAYYYPARKIFPLTLHWISFAFVMVLNYVIR